MFIRGKAAELILSLFVIPKRQSTWMLSILHFSEGKRWLTASHIPCVFHRMLCGIFRSSLQRITRNNKHKVVSIVSFNHLYKRETEVQAIALSFLIFFTFLCDLKSGLAVQNPNSYNSIKHPIYNKRWKNKSVGGVKRETGQCKGDEKGSRQGNGGVDQKLEGQAKRCGLKRAPCRVCDGLFLHRAQLMRLKSILKNQYYRCGFHIADSVFISTLSFFIQLTVTDCNIIFELENIPQIHSLSRHRLTVNFNVKHEQ